MATHQSTTTTRPIRARAHEILADAAAAPLAEPLCPLFVRAGDTFHEASESIVIDCARRLARARFTTGAPVLRNTEALHSFLITRLGSRDEEVFAAILLDTHRRLIEYVELFHGALDGAPVYVREVAKYVAATRAAEVIIVHNHPSGDATPSLPDLAVTARIRESLRLIDVKLLDHLDDAHGGADTSPLCALRSPPRRADPKTRRRSHDSCAMSRRTRSMPTTCRGIENIRTRATRPVRRA